MHSIRFTILFITLFSLNNVMAAQWRHILGDGMAINRIAIHPHNPSNILVTVDTPSTSEFPTGDFISEKSETRVFSRPTLLGATFLGFQSEIEDITHILRTSGIEGRVTNMAFDPQNLETLYLVTHVRSGEGDLDFKTHIYRSAFDRRSTRWIKTAELDADSRVSDFIIDPHETNVLYLAAAYGLYRSDDRGENWQAIGKVPRLYEGEVVFDGVGTVTAMAVNPINPEVLYTITMDTIFSGGPPRGLFRSINHGETWEWRRIPASLGAYNPQERTSIAIDPHHPETLYVSTMSRTSCFPPDHKHYDSGCEEAWGHIYKTTDSGRTARIVAEEQMRAQAVVIAVDPHNTENVWAGTKTGLYRSADSGETWHLLSNPVDGVEPHIRSLAIHPYNPEILYIGTLHRGLYEVTTDSDCIAHYKTDTQTVQIPCLKVDNAETLLETELKAKDTETFGVSSVQNR